MDLHVTRHGYRWVIYHEFSNFLQPNFLFSDLRGAEVPAWKINERCWKTAFAMASVLTDYWKLSPLLHSVYGFGNYSKLWLVRVWLFQSSLGVFFYIFCVPAPSLQFHKKSVDSLFCYVLLWSFFSWGLGGHVLVHWLRFPFSTNVHSTSRVEDKMYLLHCLNISSPCRVHMWCCKDLLQRFHCVDLYPFWCFAFRDWKSSLIPFLLAKSWYLEVVLPLVVYLSCFKEVMCITLLNCFPLGMSLVLSEPLMSIDVNRKAVVITEIASMTSIWILKTSDSSDDRLLWYNKYIDYIDIQHSVGFCHQMWHVSMNSPVSKPMALDDLALWPFPVLSAVLGVPRQSGRELQVVFLWSFWGVKIGNGNQKYTPKN